MPAFFPRSVLRKLFPHPATAALLAGLVLVVWAIRAAVVSPKALTKAAERFATARQAEHPSFKWDDAAVLGTHWASLAALGILLLVFLTIPWWHPRTAGNDLEMKTDGPEPLRAPLVLPENAKRPSRWYRWSLLFIVILAGTLRLPLAFGSLWWDEAWNVKYATVGEWRQSEENPDEVRFQPSSWQRAAWFYNKPTNHPVLTLPSKFCHNVWKSVTGAPEGTFSEPVLRLPVLLAGLGALLITAGLARRLSGEIAGICVAVLMALHPWLMRYGVDARSYGMAVLFMAGALASLERATSGDTRRPGVWWWIFGLCQFLLMWAHVVSHLSVCLSLVVAAGLLIWKGPSNEKGRLFAQLLVVNAVAAGLLLVAFLPNLLQALTWGERNDDGNLLTGTYFLRTISQMAAGQEPWLVPNDAGIPTLGWPWLLLVTAIGLVMAVTGAVNLRRRSPRGLIILLSAVCFGGLFLLVVRVTGFYFYHRFILVLIVPVLVLVAAGLAGLHAGIRYLAVVPFFMLVTQQGTFLWSRSYEPFREVINAMRRETDGKNTPPLLPVAYGLGSHVMQIYLPNLRDIRGTSEEGEASLRALIDQSRRENRPLLLTWGYDGINRQNMAGGFKLIDDPALFEKIGEWSGIEPEFTFRLVKLKPAAP